MHDSYNLCKGSDETSKFTNFDEDCLHHHHTIWNCNKSNYRTKYNRESEIDNGTSSIAEFRNKDGHSVNFGKGSYCLSLCIYILNLYIIIRSLCKMSLKKKERGIIFRGETSGNYSLVKLINIINLIFLIFFTNCENNCFFLQY